MSVRDLLALPEIGPADGDSLGVWVSNNTGTVRCLMENEKDIRALIRIVTTQYEFTPLPTHPPPRPDPTIESRFFDVVADAFRLENARAYNRENLYECGWHEGLVDMTHIIRHDLQTLGLDAVAQKFREDIMNRK